MAHLNLGRLQLVWWGLASWRWRRWSWWPNRTINVFEGCRAGPLELRLFAKDL